MIDELELILYHPAGCGGLLATFTTIVQMLRPASLKSLVTFRPLGYNISSFNYAFRYRLWHYYSDLLAQFFLIYVIIYHIYLPKHTFTYGLLWREPWTICKALYLDAIWCKIIQSKATIRLIDTRMYNQSIVQNLVLCALNNMRNWHWFHGRSCFPSSHRNNEAYRRR